MRKRPVLAIFFILHGTVALGSTYYVDNSCGTNGNGTTTTCGANGPFNRINNAFNSACTGSDAGKVIEIRAGTGVYRERAAAAGRCIGSVGNPAIVQNYAGENVLVEGTTDAKSGHTWTSRGGGVFECTSGTYCSFSGVYWHTWYTINNGAEQELVLDKQNLASCTSGSETPGHMGIVSSSGNLCVNIDGGTSPTDTAVTSFMLPTMIDFAEPFPNGKYVTFRKNPGGGSFTIRRFRNKIFELTQQNTGYTFDGLTVGWVYDRCIATTIVPGGLMAQGLRVLNNTISYCGQESIRIEADTGGALVQNNDVSHDQDPVVFPLGSGVRVGFDNCTPIRIAQSQNVTVKNNTVHDNCGGGTGGARAIDLEYSNSGNTIDSNYIYNLHSASGASGAGIRISSCGCSTCSGGSNAGMQCSGAADCPGGSCVSAETWSNNLITNNRIYNTDNCFAFDGQGFANTGSGNLYANNTCAESTAIGLYGYSSGFDNVGIDFKNNIFIDTQGAAPTGGFVSVGSSGFGGLTKPVYGAYYCSTCAANTRIVSFKGTSAVNTQASVVSFDPNSGYGTINLSESGSPPTLQLTACGDMACNKGTTLANVPVDYRGTIRPQPAGGAYDIGAHELSSGGLPPPTLVSVQPMP